MSRVEVDARRLLCPMPVIRLQNAVNELSPGDEVEITCTDPGALNDIPAWCRINGHTVVSSHQNGNEWIIEVRVGGSEA